MAPSVYWDENAGGGTAAGGAGAGTAPGRWVYRMSAIGDCLNALVAARKGFEATFPPEQLQATFDAGTAAEDDALADLPFSVSDRQLEVEIDMPERGTLIRGHVDGLTYSEVVEIKSQGQSTWDLFERFGWERGLWPKYRWQVSAEMIATHRPAVVVRYNRETGEVRWELVEEPFYTLDDLRARVATVEILAGMSLRETCDEKRWGCGYCHLYGDPPYDHRPDAAMAAEEFMEAKEDFARARGRLDMARDVLEHSVAKDKTKLDTGINITFYDSERRGCDWKRAIAEGVDLSPYFTTTKARSVKVYRREPGEGAVDGPGSVSDGGEVPAGVHGGVRAPG